MQDLISRQAAINLLKKWSDGYSWLEIETDFAIEEFKQLPAAQPEKVCVAEIKVKGEELQRCIDEAVERIKAEVKSEIIRCEDCKHRPTFDEDEELHFPTYKCPCQCEDSYYSWMPKDDWFCGNGERKKEEEDEKTTL